MQDLLTLVEKSSRAEAGESTRKTEGERVNTAAERKKTTVFFWGGGGGVQHGGMATGWLVPTKIAKKNFFGI